MLLHLLLGQQNLDAPFTLVPQAVCFFEFAVVKVDLPYKHQSHSSEVECLCIDELHMFDFEGVADRSFLFYNIC